MFICSRLPFVVPDAATFGGVIVADIVVLFCVSGTRNFTSGNRICKNVDIHRDFHYLHFGALIFFFHKSKLFMFLTADIAIARERNLSVNQLKENFLTVLDVDATLLRLAYTTTLQVVDEVIAIVVQAVFYNIVDDGCTILVFLAANNNSH